MYTYIVHSELRSKVSGYRAETTKDGLLRTGCVKHTPVKIKLLGIPYRETFFSGSLG